MKQSEQLLKILKEEYGITSARELEQAMKKLGFIDLLPFCGDIDNRKKKDQAL